LIKVVLLLIPSLLEPGAAFGSESYMRTVRIDWEKIPRAVNYEVQYFSKPSCSTANAKGAKVLVSEKPFARLDLPPGPFCFRVRGVGEKELRGDWSDFRGFDIPAPAPKNVEGKGRGKFAWDAVPNAEGYAVDVKSSSGKPLLSTTTKTPEVQLPRELVDDLKRKGERVKLDVRTEIPGVARSPAAVTEAAPAQATVTPKKRELPAQPEPVLPEIEVVLDRVRSLGEKPVMPDPRDWKYANTPEKKENLRRRTIASADIELAEGLELSRSKPDLRFELGSRIGSMGYVFVNGQDETETDRREWAGAAELNVELNRHRPWGAFARFSYQPWLTPGVPSGFTRLALGPTYRVSLDSFWSSVLSFGAGVDFSSFSLFRQNPGAGAISSESRPFGLIGFNGWVSGQWSFPYQLGAEATFLFRAYGGALVGADDFEASGIETELQGKMTYGLTDSLGVYLGANLSMNAMSIGNGDTNESTLRQYQASISTGVTYELDPRSRRAPAAERVMMIDQRDLLDLRLLAPVGLRSAFLSEGSEQLSGTELNVSGDLSARFSFGRRSNWGIRIDAQLGNFQFDSAVLATYDRFLFRRQDLKAGIYFGPYLSADSFVGGNEQQLDMVGLRIGLRARKGFSRRLWAELEFEGSFPSYVAYGNGGSRGLGDVMVRMAPAIGIPVTRWLDLMIRYELQMTTFSLERNSGSASSLDRGFGLDNLFGAGFRLQF
jgi:hypothetical protein